MIATKYEVICGLGILLATSILLVLADRVIRIGPLLEPFVSQCGVDMEPCAFPLQCINGYCKATNTPRIPAMTDLPVLP